MDVLENLEVWKRSCRLSADLYKAVNSSHEFGFKDQITRAALSIPSNIAEGFERESAKSRIQYLKIAKGSCGELWTQLLIGQEAGIIDRAIVSRMAREVRELSKMLHGLIKYFERELAAGD